MTGGGGFIVKVNAAGFEVPLPFVAVKVTLYGLPAFVPAAGVPEINPVAVLTVRPAGNGAALQVVMA